MADTAKLLLHLPPECLEAAQTAANQSGETVDDYIAGLIKAAEPQYTISAAPITGDIQTAGNISTDAIAADSAARVDVGEGE